MKKILFAVTAAAALGLSTGALADEADAKTAGCLGKCHDMNKEKAGPSYKDVSKKFKGKGEAAILAAYKANKEHADNKATEDQVKKVTSWLLTLP
jgi:cytochrome c551/c552